MTTPLPESTTKRAFVVKKRKKAEALAARAMRQRGRHDKESQRSKNWLRFTGA